MTKHFDYNFLRVNTHTMRLFSIFVIYMWPILEIILGFIYKDKLVCLENSTINIGIWLIVKGFFTFIEILMISLFFLSNKNTLCKNLTKIIIGIIIILNFPILFTGSIMFWKNCIYLKPLEINIFIWVTIIFSYIGLIYSIFIIFNNKKEQRIPLLDVY